MTQTEPALEFTAGLAQSHPYRWRLHRAGIQNVWRYLEQSFEIPGGRVIWRGANGSGKSRALELLLPYLLDGDKQAMDSTNARKVSLDQLMQVCTRGASNRIGVLWLELRRTDPDRGEQYKTIGAHLRRSEAAKTLHVEHFITELRVGFDLVLMDPATRQMLPLARLKDLVGEEHCTPRAREHRARVAREVFGLEGVRGSQRFDALISLLRTLRSPDVGDQIDQRGLPALLTDALPPLDEDALRTAGTQLDMLVETRDRLADRVKALDSVETFLTSYTQHVAGHLHTRAETVLAGLDRVRGATRALEAAQGEHRRATDRRTELQGAQEEATAEAGRLEGQIRGIESSDDYREAAALDTRARGLDALKATADIAWAAVASSLTSHGTQLDAARQTVETATDLCDATTSELGAARALLGDVGLAHHLPSSFALHAHGATPARVRVRDHAGAPERDASVEQAPTLELPTDPDALQRALGEAQRAVVARAAQAGLRAEVATQLAEANRRLADLHARADTTRAEATAAADRAAEAAEDRDDEARRLAHQWHTWASGDHPAVAGAAACDPLVRLRDADHLTGPGAGDDLDELDDLAQRLLRPALDAVAGERADLARADRDDQLRAGDLARERGKLADEVDPEPPTGPGHTSTPDGAWPLWRALDFTDDLPTGERAAIEAALHASGLLTASLHPDGAVLTGDGQVALDTTTPLAAHPLSTVVAPDPTCPMDPQRVWDVLARISWGDLDHPAAVTAQGAWRLGLLRGRHHSTAPRYIGASARAAGRAARIAEIDDELTALKQAELRRASRRTELEALRGEIADLAHKAPRTHPLRTARSAAIERDKFATTAAELAGAAELAAHGAQTAYDHDLTAHQAACAEHDLPAGPADLDRVRADLREAEAACVRAEHALGRATRAISAATTQLTAASDRWPTTIAEIGEARTHEERWSGEDAEVASIRASLGVDLATLEAQLIELRAQHKGHAERAKKAGSDLVELGERIGALTEKAAQAEGRLTEDRADVRAHVKRLLDLTHLDGVLHTVGLDEQALPDLDQGLDQVRATTTELHSQVATQAAKAPTARAPGRPPGPAARPAHRPLRRGVPHRGRHRLPSRSPA